MKHKHADIITAFANGEKIQFCYINANTWHDFDADDGNEAAYLLGAAEHLKWRVAPAIWVNIYNKFDINAVTFSSRKEADEWHEAHFGGVERFACIKVAEGEGL